MAWHLKGAGEDACHADSKWCQLCVHTQADPTPLCCRKPLKLFDLNGTVGILQWNHLVFELGMEFKPKFKISMALEGQMVLADTFLGDVVPPIKLPLVRGELQVADGIMNMLLAMKVEGFPLIPSEKYPVDLNSIQFAIRITTDDTVEYPIIFAIEAQLKYTSMFNFLKLVLDRIQTLTVTQQTPDGMDLTVFMDVTQLCITQPCHSHFPGSDSGLHGWPRRDGDNTTVSFQWAFASAGKSKRDRSVACTGSLVAVTALCRAQGARVRMCSYGYSE